MRAASVNPEPGSNSPSKTEDPERSPCVFSDSQSLSHSSVVKVQAPTSRTGYLPFRRAHETCSAEEPANSTRARTEIASLVVRSGSERPPAGHRPGQGQLVRVLEVAPHREPVRRAGHAGAQGGQRALQVDRRGL